MNKQADKPDSALLHAEADAELQELREAALLLGHELKDFGRARIRAAGADLGDTSAALRASGREAMSAVTHRIGSAEKVVENSMREHPATWVAATMGVIGTGVLLGMLMRRRS